MHQKIIPPAVPAIQEPASAGSSLNADEKLALLAAIVESSDDAIISKTLDGIITSWNKGAERIFGYKASEMIGRPITILIPDDRLDEEPLIIERLKKGEPVNHFETLRKTRDGKLIDISLTISPIRNKNGHIIGASKTARDISEMKKLERRKDDFIRMASHELKTPITSIKGYVQLVMDNLSKGDGQLNQETRSQLGRSLSAVEKQVNKMVALITEMLDLSRIEFGKLQLHKTSFNLSELVKEIIDEMALTTNHHHILLHENFDGDIYADPYRISQVLTNLISNAIKYSPQSDKVEIFLEKENNDVIINVRDHGIGIDPAVHDQIFERFFRVEGRNAQTFPGFGIGLFIVAEIIQLHGGTIRVESQEGKGASFVVRLPDLNK